MDLTIAGVPYGGAVEYCGTCGTAQLFPCNFTLLDSIEVGFDRRLYHAMAWNDFDNDGNFFCAYSH